MAITTPRFLPNFYSAVIPGAGTFLLTETLPTVLNGKLYEAVCPLIDGVRTEDEIVTALSDTFQPAEVYYALRRLADRGFIEEAESSIPDHVSALWHSLGTAPNAAVAALQGNPVQVRILGDIDPDLVQASLSGSGLVTAPAADVLLVVTDDYRRPEIDEIDAKARANGQRYGLVKPVGAFPWIGPYLSPDQTGCWQCLTDRIRMNLTTDTFVEERTGKTPVTSSAYLQSSVVTALNQASLELAKWIVRGETELADTLTSWSIADFRQERHTVVPRPQCRRCGEEDYRARRTKFRAPEPLPLQSRLHLHSLEGGHRTATPEQTLAKYEHFVSPITGVVSRLDRVSRSDHPVVHAYSANHNWATHPDSLSFLRNTLRSQSGGKGTTDLQAKVGALAEAFERYSGVFRGDEIRRRATMAELQAEGELVVHPADVMLFSESQYADRKTINARGDSFQLVPEPFDESQPADWSPTWAPTSGKFHWVPTGLLYYSYSKLAPHETPNRMAFYADSNGCASGNSLEEAALQGLLELVERDAIATWWYNQVSLPQVDIDDLNNPYLDDLRQWLDQQGRDLWVVDVTNDIGIPTFAAVSKLKEPLANGSENVVVGFGAHLEPATGILRSITEVNQFFASLEELGENDLEKAFDPGAVEWWQTASVVTKPYLVPAPGPAKKLSDYPPLTSPDLHEEVLTAVRMIEERGPEVLFLEQTRPDAKFPVVKALAPGLRHFWSRLAPGRLYDVPVDLGWLEQPIAEGDLNPTPVFF